MSEQILTVGEFVALVNQTLEFAYPVVVIEGEVSQFKVWRDQFVYFDLKDEEAIVNCFMSVHQLKTPLEDGMRLRLTAAPKITKKGRFSLTVRSYELAGEGELQRAFELLKAKLEKEGLFAPERKRDLPPFPQRLAVVSSSQAAGYRDFIEVAGQRWGGVRIELADVQVQGEAAPDQIVNAINYFNQETPLADVLVIIRGGGSLEDLQAFNTEPVVRAIAGSRIPTIVGVGHEVDVTLADLVADVRAATPTDAARRVVPDRGDLLQQLTAQQNHIWQSLRHLLQSSQHSIDRATQRLEQFLQLPKLRVQSLSEQLQKSTMLINERLSNRLDGLLRLLKNIDPTQVLQRGYSITRHQGKVVKRAAQVKTGDRLVIQLAKDQLRSEVTDA